MSLTNPARYDMIDHATELAGSWARFAFIEPRTIANQIVGYSARFHRLKVVNLLGCAHLVDSCGNDNRVMAAGAVSFKPRPHKSGMCRRWSADTSLTRPIMEVIDVAESQNSTTPTEVPNFQENVSSLAPSHKDPIDEIAKLWPLLSAHSRECVFALALGLLTLQEARAKVA